MTRAILGLVLLMPIVNFAHESAHWCAYRSRGIGALMRLQRVQAPDSMPHDATNEVIVNLAGPVSNIAAMGVGFLYPPAAIVGISAALHRASAQIVGLIMAAVGNSRFTNDESAVVSERLRPILQLLALFGYGLATVKLTGILLGRGRKGQAIVILVGTVLWIAYGFLLDAVDRSVLL